MKSFILSFVGLILFSGSLLAQITRSDLERFDSNYGKDPALFKGIKYFQERRCDFGHPFLIDNKAMLGKLSLENKIYDQVWLYYNVYDQELLMEYDNYLGAKTQIILNSNQVNWFEIEGKRFVNSVYKNIKNPYIESLGSDSGVLCLIAYNKDYTHNNKADKNGFGYSKLYLKKYIVVAGEPILFKTKRKFLKLLPKQVESHKEAIAKKLPNNLRHMQSGELQKICDDINSMISNSHE